MNKRFDAHAVGTARIGTFVIFTPTEDHLQLLNDLKVIDARLAEARVQGDAEIVDACMHERVCMHEVLVETLNTGSEVRVMAIHGIRVSVDNPEPVTVQDIDVDLWETHKKYIIREHYLDTMIGASDKRA